MRHAARDTCAHTPESSCGHGHTLWESVWSLLGQGEGGLERIQRWTRAFFAAPTRIPAPGEKRCAVDVLHFTPEWLPTASWSPWRTCWWSCPRAHVDRGPLPTPGQFTIQASQEVPARSSRAERRLVPRAWQSRDQVAADFCKCPTLSSGAATRQDHLVNLRVRPSHSGSVLRPARAPAQCFSRHKRTL